MISDLLNEFVQESKVHISEMEAGLLCLEDGDCDIAMINRIFRAVHNIKGTAGFFELNKIVELSHGIENLFGALRDQRVNVTPDMIDALLLATDVLKELVSNPAENESCDITSHLTDVISFLPKVQAQKIAPATIVIPAVPPLKNGQSGREVRGASVRVGIELLDDLLNMVGEMVLRRNQLLRIAENAGKDVPQLDIVAQGIDNLTTNLQEKVMRTRMQPVANVFNKFPRIIRELSRKMDKEAELVMQGMNVELDRSIIEALLDPITHLVRNALDHGIEPPKTRVLKNKPATATIFLHAYHESGRVIIDISDDGAGIDIEKIKEQALAKGWLAEKEITAIRETEILNFIFRPGFSTAQYVTDISGRGVGMDVVKTNIEKLGGKIEIKTELGTGTTFRLILPLTLAIISSVIVEASGDTFAIPQANVKELVLIQPEDKNDKKIEFVHSYPVLRLRNQLLPLIRLSDVLKISPESAGKDCNVYTYFSNEKQTFRILVIKTGNYRYGLVVDTVFDTEEILVKPVPAVLGTSGRYSGLTVLGDGRIAMIIDPESIRAAVNLYLVEATRQADSTDEEKSQSGGDEQYVLLFKCSGSEMLGLDLTMVARVQEIPPSCIQKIGGKYYFSFQGETVWVIRPEHYLPISQRKNSLSRIYIILPKMLKYPVGIIAEEIHDTVLTTIRLDANGVCGQGITGSTMIDNTVVTLVNLHELLQKAAPEYYGRNSAELKKTATKYAGEMSGAKKAVILLVEDMVFFARNTKSYLESEGYEVITAENGREAYQLLSEKKVDVVISDIEMPVMNGIELVRAIRSSETLKHLPVIALTSLTGDGHKEKGLRAGFDLYEFKLDRMRLLESVAEILQKNNRCIE